MPARGLIVAIESYAQMQEGLSPRLDGTHAGALAFRKWLVEERGVDPDEIRFCAEEELPGRTAGATLTEIVEQINKLVANGQNTTEQLFVYVAGHGFCYTDIDGVRVADVLLASDYDVRPNGWRTCVSIDEIQKWLRLSLGPLDHFYFVDCCRNGISARDIRVAQVGPYPASDLGFPAVYMLYSTTEGQLANVQSGFPRVLVDGLNGDGRAKDWYQGQMAVLFRTLKPYVVKKLPGQAVDGRDEGNHDGLIRIITPTPGYTCTVLVEGAEADEEFTLEVSTWPEGHRLGSRQFKGPRCELREPPDTYQLSVSAAGVELTTRDPLPADLFSDCTIRFSKPRARRRGRPEPGVSPVPPPSPTQVRAPQSGRVVVRRAGEEEGEEGAGEFHVDLAPGTYIVEVLDDRDVAVRREELHVGVQPPDRIDLAQFERSPLRDALLQAIPGNHHDGAVDFSETLGPMPDQGLDLWLGVIGAARILLSPQEDFSKLGPLPLASFDQIAPDACPLYLLAGLEDGAPLAVGVDAPLVARPGHLAIPGLTELVVPHLGAGVHLLGVRVGAGGPLTLPVPALPNRATLVTLWRDARGTVCFGQFVLPLPHLAGRLPYGHKLGYGPPLRIVRRLVELQRQFAASRVLTDVIDFDELMSLLYVKWFEPVATLLAAYELARRGEREGLAEAVGNLRTYFGEFPDTEAIARRADLNWSMPANPPLVLDGLLALDRMPGLLPLPPEDLLYEGPWTLWRRAP